MADHFIGIDIGTTGTKAVLVRRDGVVIGYSSAEYAVDTPHPGWAEQRPDVWLHAVSSVVLDLFDKTRINPVKVSAIGLSGQMHSTVLVDEAGQVIRPAIIWADQRSAEQVERVYNQIGQEQLAAWTGNPLATGFMLASWLWLRENEPESIARTTHLLLPKDYVRSWLTGTIGTEASDAASTLLFSPQKRNWSIDLLQALNLPAHLLPSVSPSASVAGWITQEAAQATGLLAGTPVIFGGSDQAMQALGNGVVYPGTILATIGTGGQLFAPTATCIIDHELRMHSFCHILPDVWHVETAMLSAGLSLKWLRDSVFHGQSYTQMADAALQVPAGAEGLLYLPHLAGERTPYMDSKSRGAFVGLTLRHTAAHMTRAVMEGVVFAMRQGLDLMASLSVPADRVVASGGATAHPLWKQLQADIYQRTVSIAQTQNAAAVGAAMLAAHGNAGGREMDSIISQWVPVTMETLSPDEDKQSLYDKQYRAFLDLYPALSHTNHSLADTYQI